MSSELQYHPPRNQGPAGPGRAPFIVFEGGDGTGKSTQAGLLAERLEQAGHRVVHTREPGGTVIGESLRALVLEHGQGQIDPHTEALIYAAARAAHAHQRILPALEDRQVVVCDRYIDSSAAYQGAGRGLGMEEVTALSRWATGDLLPDLTLCLRLDPEQARGRVGRRGAADRLETEPDSFHARVAEGFEELARSGGSRVVVEAAGTVAEVHERIWDVVTERLPSLAGGLAGSEEGAPAGSGTTRSGPSISGEEQA